MRYEPAALDFLVTQTNGQPFLTQAVAFELVECLNEQDRLVARPSDVEEAIRRAMGSGIAYFANVWSDAGVEARLVLLALANGRHPAPTSPTSRSLLRRRDILTDDDRFCVPMLERWVRDHTETES